MKDFVEKFRASVTRFMYGRYGSDQLGLALVSLALVLSIVGSFAGRWVAVLSTALAIVAVARMLSRDIDARRKENRSFLKLIAKPRRWCKRQYIKWQNRDTKAYVRCPHCHTEFALPKGRGKVRATCPKCGEKSEHTV